MIHKTGKPKLVEVEWQDARTLYKELEFDEVEEKATLVKRQTVGYLYKLTKDEIKVCHTYDPGEPTNDTKDGGADWTTIPRCWGTRITYLSPAEPTPQDFTPVTEMGEGD